MKKIFLLFSLLLFSCSSSTVTEKHSETLSQVVYATSDSIDFGRFDLADQYIKQTTKLVVPPEVRIPVAPVKSVKNKTSNNVVVIPPHLQGQQIVVVNSKEYDSLLSEKQNSAVLKNDLDALTLIKKEVDEELIRQKRLQEQLTQKYNNLLLDLKDKQNALLKKNILIGTLILGISGYIFLKAKNLLIV